MGLAGLIPFWGLALAVLMHSAIRVMANAFGENRPSRDLFLSPGHSVCVDFFGETLVPVGRLANGATIAQLDVDEVTYWHIELDEHDIVLAEAAYLHRRRSAAGTSLPHQGRMLPVVRAGAAPGCLRASIVYRNTTTAGDAACEI